MCVSATGQQVFTVFSRSWRRACYQLPRTRVINDGRPSYHSHWSPRVNEPLLFLVLILLHFCFALPRDEWRDSLSAGRELSVRPSGSNFFFLPFTTAPGPRTRARCGVQRTYRSRVSKATAPGIGIPRRISVLFSSVVCFSVQRTKNLVVKSKNGKCVRSRRPPLLAAKPSRRVGVGSNFDPNRERPSNVEVEDLTNQKNKGPI